MVGKFCFLFYLVTIFMKWTSDTLVHSTRFLQQTVPKRVGSEEDLQFRSKRSLTQQCHQLPFNLFDNSNTLRNIIFNDISLVEFYFDDICITSWCQLLRSGDECCLINLNIFDCTYFCDGHNFWQMLYLFSQLLNNYFSFCMFWYHSYHFDYYKNVTNLPIPL